MLKINGFVRSTEIHTKNLKFVRFLHYHFFVNLIIISNTYYIMVKIIIMKLLL